MASRSLNKSDIVRHGWELYAPLPPVSMHEGGTNATALPASLTLPRSALRFFSGGVGPGLLDARTLDPVGSSRARIG